MRTGGESGTRRRRRAGAHCRKGIPLRTRRRPRSAFARGSKGGGSACPGGRRVELSPFLDGITAVVRETGDQSTDGGKIPGGKDARPAVAGTIDAVQTAFTERSACSKLTFWWAARDFHARVPESSDPLGYERQCAWPKSGSTRFCCTSRSGWPTKRATNGSWADS